jgi:hypothetical protein
MNSISLILKFFPFFWFCGISFENNPFLREEHLVLVGFEKKAFTVISNNTSKTVFHAKINFKWEHFVTILHIYISKGNFSLD